MAVTVHWHSHHTIQNLELETCNLKLHLFQCPLLQSVVICLAADPLSRFLIEEERDRTAIAFVKFPHERGVGFVMPYLELCDVYPLFLL